MRSLGLGIATVSAFVAFAAPAAAEPVPGLDATFGVDGIASAPVDPGPITGLVLQPDGKVVVLNLSYTRRFAFDGNSLIRFNSDGSLDPTFGGGDGIVSESATAPAGGGLALQPDGKLIVGGHRVGAFTVTRYNPDGSVDGGFGSGGVATIAEPASAIDQFLASILVQPDGKIVVAGSAGRGELYLIRLDAAGNPDPSFDSDGVMTALPPVFDFTESESLDPRYLHLQPDGRIVVSMGYRLHTPSGDSDPGESRSGTLAARVNPNGTLDTSFGGGSDGFVELERGGPTLLPASDGRLIFGGSDPGFTSFWDIGALRADGTVDPAFTPPQFNRFAARGQNPQPLSRGSLSGLAEAADGRLVATGSISTRIDRTDSSQLGVAMTEANGALLGMARLDLGAEGSAAGRLVEQPDGRMITAGSVDGDFAVFRLIQPDALACVLTTPEVFSAERLLARAIKKLRQAKRRDQGVQRAKQRVRDARAGLRAAKAAAPAALGC